MSQVALTSIDFRPWLELVQTLAGLITAFASTTHLVSHEH